MVTSAGAVTVGGSLIVTELFIVSGQFGALEYSIPVNVYVPAPKPVKVAVPLASREKVAEFVPSV